MEYLVSEEELRQFENYFNMMGYEPMQELVSKIKSKQPVEEMASGDTKTISGTFINWCLNQYADSEFRVFIEVSK